MNNKFKVGDKVERVTGSWHGHKVGAIAVIQSICGGNIYFEEHGEGYDPAMYKLHNIHELSLTTTELALVYRTVGQIISPVPESTNVFQKCHNLLGEKQVDLINDISVFENTPKFNRTEIIAMFKRLSA